MSNYYTDLRRKSTYSNDSDSRRYSDLRRKSTYIRKYGTEAWRWLNAEDSNVSYEQPVGYSFYQRNNTYKQMRRSKGFSLQSQNSSNNSQYLNYIKYLSSNEQSYTAVDLDPIKEEVEARIQRPEAAFEKQKNESDPNKRKNLKIPSALYNPDVLRQIRQMKRHSPYFMYLITLVQILGLVFSVIKNYYSTHRFVADLNENPMIGPYPSTLINLGARFLPCMQPTNFTGTDCPPGIVSSKHYTQYQVDEYGQFMAVDQTSNYCTIADICGMGMQEGEPPYQWFRFILPIFLHAGVVHLLFNLIFQIRTGFPMEKEFGTWRMAIIYMLSGIFGFMFEAKSVGYSPSVGCSGALYGLLACLLLDLIQSWKIIVKPWWELFKLLILIVISLGFGLIPYIDNFAHIGGFIMGLLTGIILLPIIVFSKKGLIIKRFLMVISTFAVAFLFVWALREFYINGKVCKWCKYLSCIPIKEGWCDYESMY